MKDIECKHYKDTEHGTIDCINPYSGICQKCGKQVKPKQPSKPKGWFKQILRWFIR